ncbi:putative Zinc finger CCCH domain-containing protein, partial [Naja naja]
KAKKESGPKEEKRKRDVPAQPAKSAKPASGGKSQQPPAPHPPPQAQPAGFSAHKEIKLTLLNKAADKNSSRKRYEPSDKDRQASPPTKRVNLSPGTRDRKLAGRLSSPKQDRQRGPNPKPSPAQPDKKRPLSPPPSKSSSKVTSIPGKAAEPVPPAAPAKSGKSSTLSRREELLKQLKAVEDAIARKRAKIPGKV